MAIWISQAGGGGGAGTLTTYADISTPGQFGSIGTNPQSWAINPPGSQIVIAYQDPNAGVNSNKFSITSDGVNFVNYPGVSSGATMAMPASPSITYPNRWVFRTPNNQIYYSDNMFGGSPTYNIGTSLATGLSTFTISMVFDRWVGVALQYSPTPTLYYIYSTDGINFTAYNKYSGTNQDIMLMAITGNNNYVVMAGVPTNGYYISTTAPANVLNTWTLNKSSPGGNAQGVQGITYSATLDKFVVVADRGYIYTSTSIGAATEINLSAIASNFNDVVWNTTKNEFIAVGSTLAGSPLVMKSTDGITWSQQTHSSMPLAGQGFINKVLWSTAYQKYYCFGQKNFGCGYEMFIATFNT